MAMRGNMFAGVLVFVGARALTGCVAGTDDDSPVDGTNASEFSTITQVTLQGRSKPVVTVHRVPRTVALEWTNRRLGQGGNQPDSVVDKNGLGTTSEALTIINDSCGGNRFNIYSRTYYNIYASGDMICFTGHGVANLTAQWTLCGQYGCGHWGGASRSVATGDNWGFLCQNEYCTGSYEYFASWTPVPVLTSIGDNATWVYLP